MTCVATTCSPVDRLTVTPASGGSPSSRMEFPLRSVNVATQIAPGTVCAPIRGAALSANAASSTPSARRCRSRALIVMGCSPFRLRLAESIARGERLSTGVRGAPGERLCQMRRCAVKWAAADFYCDAHGAGVSYGRSAYDRSVADGKRWLPVRRDALAAQTGAGAA